MPNRNAHNSALGKWGESRAAGYLEAQGYTVLERRWRLHQQGEIDLILLTPDQQTLVFLEVKTRHLHQKESAYQALLPKKARAFHNAIQAYLQSPSGREASGLNLRVDWLVILKHPDGTHAIDHLQHITLESMD